MNETLIAATNGFIEVAAGLLPGSAAKVLTESAFIKDSVFSYIDENGDVVVGEKQNKINKIFNETLNSVATEDDIKNIFSDDWNSGSNPDSGPKYLTFTAEEDNSTISLKSVNNPDIKYSLNEGEWTQWDYSDITLNTGDTVRMKGNNSNGFSMGYSYNRFKMTGKIGASGNIMSLLYEDDFEGKLTIPCSYCYAYMFADCTSLTTAPELPATILTEGCYTDMFLNCTSLTTAPELPAITLAVGCYAEMFQNCSSLTTAPELLATTLAMACYYQMFHYCTKLNYIKMLATNISADGCLQSWLVSVSSTGTFVKHPNMTSLPSGSSGIPTGWTVQDAA